MTTALNSHEFEGRIRDIHNHLYANANIRTNEGIAQELTKLVMALSHQAHRRNRRPIEATDVTAVLSGQQVLTAVHADSTREMFEEANKDLELYPKDTRLLLDDSSLAAAVALLSGIDFASGERDWLGDTVEAIRLVESKRLGGQFFTDQRITELSVDLLEFDPSNGDDFVDICAGTGGFLLAALKHLLRNGMEDYCGVVKGVEVDQELAAAANGNLGSLASIGEAVTVTDSLACIGSGPTIVRDGFVFETHLCLASNPPFGTKITVKDKNILNQFELARRWKKNGKGWVSTTDISARPPDILFIEKNIRLAEPGRGRIALVTPYQVLSGPQLGYVRQWILRNARVRAVVDLPVDTFQPWTGTKTSLLVLERRVKPVEFWEPKLDAGHRIFMSISSHIGHDRRGNPIWDTDGEIVTDLPDIARAWKHFRNGGNPEDMHPDSFALEPDRIREDDGLRLNASFYQPTRNEVVQAVGKISSQPRWTLSTIGDEAERIFFPGRFKREYVQNGVPFFGGTQITQLLPTNVKYLSVDNPKIDELLVEKGWILVTRSGSTGIVSSVSDDMVGVAISEHVIRIVPNSKGIAGEYIEAYLRSSIGQELLSTGVYGSVIDEIAPDHISQIPIPIPPKEILDKIVQKVELARKERASSAASFRASSSRIDSYI